MVLLTQLLNPWHLLLFSMLLRSQVQLREYLLQKKGGNIELLLYQKVSIGSGHGASNPWLQEMPDPVTKATWDNYLIVSPALCKSLLNIDLRNMGQADAL